MLHCDSESRPSQAIRVVFESVPSRIVGRSIDFPQVVENVCKTCGVRYERMNIWDEIKSAISGKISPEAYQNWLSKTFFLRAEGTRLWVGVPDAVTKDWILQEYNGEIWSAIRDRNFGIRQIVYELSGSPEQPIQKSAPEEKPEIAFSPSITLNPRFTFDTFVV